MRHLKTLVAKSIVRMMVAVMNGEVKVRVLVEALSRLLLKDRWKVE